MAGGYGRWKDASGWFGDCMGLVARHASGCVWGASEQRKGKGEKERKKKLI